MDFAKSLIIAGLAIGAGVATLNSVLEVLDQPEVWVSSTTQKCVEVKDPKAEHNGLETEWSCDNLPPVYAQVWVE